MFAASRLGSLLFLGAIAFSSGFDDVLHSSCYIHFSSLGVKAGLTDLSVRLCTLATFAAVHNCSAVVPYFSRSAKRGHGLPAGANYSEKRFQERKVSWTRYLDLQSDAGIPGSQVIFEASWPEPKEECWCLSSEGHHMKKRPPCKWAMSCPHLLHGAWRWRSYKEVRGILDLVRQLHLDMREKAPGRRVYSLDIGKGGKFYQPQQELGSMGLRDFMEAANAAAVRDSLSPRRDLLQRQAVVNGHDRQLVLKRAEPQQMQLQEQAARRLHPCGAGASRQVRGFAKHMVGSVLRNMPFAHLRLRRGDKVVYYPKCSKPQNVARAFLLKLQQAAPKPWPKVVLVHSDEADEGYWRTLEEGLAGAFARVVTERQLYSHRSEDNFFAYAATPVFSELATFAMMFHPHTVTEDLQQLCPHGM